MSFNAGDLTLLTLGIRGDPPLDPDQPTLPAGIGLRWSPRQVRGFPWYGFYLFRRESLPRRTFCLSEDLAGLRPMASRDTVLPRLHGRLSSARPLVFTDDFPPAGTVEVDLAGGLRFDLPEGVEAKTVDLRIGFRDTGAGPGRTCIDFRRFALGIGPSPRTEKGVVFEVEPPPISPRVPVTSIESWGGSPRGMIVSRTTTITLPCPATRIDLRLTNREALRITALPGMNGGTRELKPGELTETVLTLTGAGITRLTLFSESVDAALLHEICWECPPAPGAQAGGAGASKVTVRALAGGTPVATASVGGSAGQVVPATLAGVGITAVEIDPGPAALVDLCYLPSRQAATFGWGEVSGFTYPLCLPVHEESYPCAGKPESFDDAKALAFSRVTYRAPEGWDAGFTALHGQLEVLVQGGPAGGPMAGRVNPELLGPQLGPAPGLERVKLPAQCPLDLVLLASLEPAMAQMLGLYFTDTSAEPGVPYDYLLLADPTGELGGSAATAQDWLAFRPDFTSVDACLAAGKSRPLLPGPAVPPPGPARAYALPGAMTRSQAGDLVDSQSNVGLWWAPPPPKPVTGGAEEPNRPVLYYPRRASLGLTQPATPPADAAYDPIPRPTLPPGPLELPRPAPPPLAVVLSAPKNPPPPQDSGEVRLFPDWPPSPISFHLVDSSLPEGWYSYRLVAQSIFGQRSALGPPAEWFQWDPPDQTPPLPLPWYYQKGSPGHHSIHPFAVALLDKVAPARPPGVAATCLDPLDRWVQRDEAYETWRAANPKVLGLRVSWEWKLAQSNQALDTREFRIYYVPGRLNELPGGIGVDDLRRPAAWAKRLRAVGFNEHIELRFEASRDPQGQPLAGSISRASGRVVRLGGSPDLSGVQPFLDHLRLDLDSVRPDRIYKILGLDDTQKTVILDGVPSLGADSPWTIGRPVRRYEVFLVPPDFQPGAELEPTLARPTVFAQIGVSVADDKTHTADDPKWAGQTWGGRFGNEGVVGGPAAIYRVLQTPPEPPELPDYPDKLLATPADYHGDSYFTFRWRVPKVGLKVHVLRALDDSLFQADRALRPRADLALPQDAALFPAAWKRPRRQAAIRDLNKLNEAGADYESLPDDALRVLAGLPDNDAAFTQITLEPLDPAKPENFDRRGPDDLDPPGHQALPDVRVYLDKLPGAATNRYLYRAVAVDGAHNRSGLSPSTPPVHLPRVAPPRRPAITRVVGGDKKISIEWSPNHEPDLAEYRLYRTDSEEASRDLRLMQLVFAGVPKPQTAPPKPELLWTDEPLPGARTFYYRLAAANDAKVESAPSAAVAARAFDDSRPSPPVWNPPAPGAEPNSVALSWSSPDPDLRCQVQRQEVGFPEWAAASGWLPRGLYSYEDAGRPPGREYVYRIRVIDSQGRVNGTFNELAA